jgi:hypothetical protein
MAWKIWDYFSLSVSPWVNSVFSFQEIDSFHRSYQVHVNGAVCGIHLWHFQYPCRSSAMHPVCSNWCSVCSAPSPSVHHTHMYTCTHVCVSTSRSSLGSSSSCFIYFETLFHYTSCIWCMYIHTYIYIFFYICYILLYFLDKLALLLLCTMPLYPW